MIEKKIKNILWYTAPLFQAGGGERLLFEGLNWLNKNGVNASLLADGKDIAPEHFFGKKEIPFAVHVISERNSKNLLRKYHEIYILIKKLNPDIIIANSQTEAVKLYLLRLIFPDFHFKYVCFIHGSFFQFSDDFEKYMLPFKKHLNVIRLNDPVYVQQIPEKIPSLNLFMRIKKELSAFAKYEAVHHSNAIFVLTEKAKREIALLYNHKNVFFAKGAFSESEIELKNQPIDLKDRYGCNGKKVIFSLCRLIEKKRVDFIIRAFSILSSTDQDVRLWIGGNGSHKKDLIKLADELGVSDKIIFIGFVADNEVIDHYMSADAFICADIADYDITTHFALALGKKVIVSAQHDFEVSAQNLHLLFQFENNPENASFKMAETLNAAISFSESSHHDYVKNHSWESYFKKLYDVMNDVF